MKLGNERDMQVEIKIKSTYFQKILKNSHKINVLIVILYFFCIFQDFGVLGFWGFGVISADDLPGVHVAQSRNSSFSDMLRLNLCGFL